MREACPPRCRRLQIRARQMGMFGSGFIEMLARQITADLQRNPRCAGSRTSSFDERTRFQAADAAVQGVPMNSALVEVFRPVGRMPKDGSLC